MRHPSKNGFTIIELIVAMAFIGIVVLSLFDLFAQERQVNREADNATIGTELAQQIMEEYRNTPYANITVGTQDFSSLLTPFPSLTNPRSASATVSQLDPNGLKKVDVAVSYTSRTGVKNIQLETVIAIKGLNR